MVLSDQRDHDFLFAWREVTVTVPGDSLEATGEVRAFEGKPHLLW